MIDENTFSLDGVTITNVDGKVTISKTEIDNEELIKNVINSRIKMILEGKDGDKLPYKNLSEDFVYDEDKGKHELIRNVLGAIALEVIYKYIDPDLWNKLKEKLSIQADDYV